MNPQRTITPGIQKFWDKQARRYDSGTRRFEEVFHDILEKTKAHLGPDDRVLDFGCATGSKTIELASAVKHVHGLDFSVEMILEAQKKKSASEAANVTFSQGTIFSEELKERSYDKIIAYSVIHLLEDYEDAVQRVHELLRPGGLFISLTACFGETKSWKTRMAYASFRLMKRLGMNPLHLNVFRVEDVESLMKRNGFQVLSSERIVHGIPACFLVARKAD